MTKLLVALLLISLFAAPIATGAGTIPQPVIKILALGDSITQGARVNGGYRLPLQQMLAEDDVAFDFIGPETINSDGMADPEHAGIGRNRIAQVEARLDTITDTPDIILLDIGTNDLYHADNLDTIETRLRSLVTAMRAKWPFARIIVATVGPFAFDRFDGVPAMNEAAIDYNSYIVWLPGVEVAFMPLRAALLGDGVHPNQAGYVVMAEAWRRAMGKEREWRVWLPWVVQQKGDWRQENAFFSPCLPNSTTVSRSECANFIAYSRKIAFTSSIVKSGSMKTLSFWSTDTSMR